MPGFQAVQGGNYGQRASGGVSGSASIKFSHGGSHGMECAGLGYAARSRVS
jgi:hypothetical protein